MANLQNVFLEQVKEKKIPVTVYLQNGVPIRGFVLGFDNFIVILGVDKKQQMIYKHAISTVRLSQNVSLS